MITEIYIDGARFTEVRREREAFHVEIYTNKSVAAGRSL
jgi:hypothetical protein